MKKKSAKFHWYTFWQLVNMSNNKVQKSPLRVLIFGPKSIQFWMRPLKKWQPKLPYPHLQFRRHCTMYVGEKSPKRQIASMMPDGQEMCEKCTYIIWQKKNSSDTCCCKLWSQKWKIKRLTAKAWSFFHKTIYIRGLIYI